MEVYVQDNIENAIKTLKRIVGKDGINRELRMRMRGVTRAGRQRLKKKEAEKRRRRREGKLL